MKFIKILTFILSVVLSANLNAQEFSTCLNEQLHALESTQTIDENADLQFLKELVKGKEIVSLGETTHGSKEVFQMKHRIIQFLVKECGYTTFAIEANMTECNMMNRYIQGAEGDPKKLLQVMGYWVWGTQEVIDMIEWMRTYNLNHTPQISFTGFDMQSYAYSLYYLNELNTSEKLELQKYLEPINQINKKIKEDQANGIYQVPDSLREEMYINCLFLREHINALEKPENKMLTQYAELLVQYATLKSKHKPENGYRDSCMAINANWLHQQKPTSKMIFWAHNGHIKRAPYTMGHYLETVGLHPYVIGFSTTSGKYVAISEGEIKDNELQQPNDSCMEYYFEQARVADFFIDLGGLKRKCSIPEKATKFREIGSMKRDEQFFDSDVISEYDAIIHISKTTGTESFYKSE